MGRQTKGSIEAEVANAIVRIHREQQGRGPREVKTQLVGDLIVVRCNGIFTPTEEKLSSTEEGRSLINSSRRELRAITREACEAEIERVVGAPLKRSFYDIRVADEAEIEIYVFVEDVERRLLKSDLQEYSSSAPRHVR